jgi:hypothetical protein
MDQNRPIQRNTFVLVAVVLFNLIWLALLFLSCQADKDLDPTATPEAGFNGWHISNYDGVILLDSTYKSDMGCISVDDPLPKDHTSNFRSPDVSPNHNEPLYNPPSTGNITPVI